MVLAFLPAKGAPNPRASSHVGVIQSFSMPTAIFMKQYTIYIYLYVYIHMYHNYIQFVYIYIYTCRYYVYIWYVYNNINMMSFRNRCSPIPLEPRNAHFIGVHTHTLNTFLLKVSVWYRLGVFVVEGSWRFIFRQLILFTRLFQLFFVFALFAHLLSSICHKPTKNEDPWRPKAKQ